MFGKPCNGDRRDQESPFFDCWDCKHEQSDVLQQVHPWAPKSVPSVKSRISVIFPVCSVCYKLGVYRHLPIEAPHYDISSVGEGRPDDVPVEVAPSDHSPSATCLSTVNLLKQMAGEVGTEKSQLTLVQVKQLWIHRNGRMLI